MQYAFIVIAIYMAFHALTIAGIYYGWADGHFPSSKPRSKERLQYCIFLTGAVLVGFGLCLAIIHS